MPGFEDGRYSPYNALVLEPFQPVKKILFGNSQPRCDCCKRAGDQRDIVLEGIKNTHIRPVRYKHDPSYRSLFRFVRATRIFTADIPVSVSGRARPSHQRGEKCVLSPVRPCPASPTDGFKPAPPAFPVSLSGSRSAVKISELFQISGNGRSADISGTYREIGAGCYITICINPAITDTRDASPAPCRVLIPRYLLCGGTAGHRSGGYGDHWSWYLIRICRIRSSYSCGLRGSISRALPVGTGKKIW